MHVCVYLFEYMHVCLSISPLTESCECVRLFYFVSVCVCELPVFRHDEDRLFTCIVQYCKTLTLFLFLFILLSPNRFLTPHQVKSNSNAVRKLNKKKNLLIFI